MEKAILAKKIGMTQVFATDGTLVPVTVLEAGPCTVVQKKTTEIDGYDAIQVGFLDKSAKNATKAEVGHQAKAGIKETVKRFLKEFRLADCSSYEVGSEIKADIFAEGDIIDVTATSKGKGYQGAIKRHNFSRGPETHGSKYHRKAGAMAEATSPGVVRKGKKMAGHMGAETVTVQNLTIVKVDADKNLILVKGSVPGAKNALITIKNAVRIAK